MPKLIQNIEVKLLNIIDTNINNNPTILSKVNEGEYIEIGNIIKILLDLSKVGNEIDNGSYLFYGLKQDTIIEEYKIDF